MAYYSEDLIDEVISQNDIVDVVSEYVTLRKSGRNFVGLCPFHREKTPSFCVSLDKQIFKCFGCSEGGNVISFIMKIENLDFWESVEFLAERASIDLTRYEQSSKMPSNTKEIKSLKETMFNINRDVGIYYHDNLVELLKEDNNLVKEYVKKRQFDTKTLTRFGIGFANGKIPLFDYLQKKGYTKEEILKAGILVQNDKGRIYDRYYSRLIFPIFDIRDRIIAFGGRVLDKSLPKYVNSPENEIYHKGKTLYLMNFAKRNRQDRIIIVEGYMDAIALQKSGFDNAVASLGTALTDDQARLLKKYTDNVIICYDQDSAGQNATLRGLDILNKRGLNVKVLKLDKPDVKDPDEYINKYGKERFKNCINNSISLVEFKVSMLEKNLDQNNLDSKIWFLTKTAEILASIDNDIEREIYINKISEKYNIGTGPIIKEIEKNKHQKQEVVALDMQALTRKIHLTTSLRKKQEQYIIALLLSHDKKIQEKIFSELDVKDIEDEDVRDLYKFIIDLKQDYDINKIDILSKLKDERLIKELTEIIYIDTQNADNEKLLNDVLISKHKKKLFLRRDEILKRLNDNISKDEKDILRLELNQIIIEISKLKSKK